MGDDIKTYKTKKRTQRVGRVEKTTVGKNVGCLALLHQVLVRIARHEQVHKRLKIDLKEKECATVAT